VRLWDCRHRQRDGRSVRSEGARGSIEYDKGNRVMSRILTMRLARHENILYPSLFVPLTKTGNLWLKPGVDGTVDVMRIRRRRESGHNGCIFRLGAFLAGEQAGRGCDEEKLHRPDTESRRHQI
jgi:hypothetical protein